MSATVIGHAECWAPECAKQLEQLEGRRPRRYCDAACKQRAFRRNGGKAPTEGYRTVPGATLAAATVPVAAVAGTTAAPKPKRVRKSRAKPPPATFSDVPSPREVVRDGEISQTAGEQPPEPDQPAALSAPVAPPVAVLVPPPPPEPEPEPPSEFWLSVLAELEAIGQHESRKGRQALAIAARMEDRGTSAASVASLSKELDRFLDEIKNTAPKRNDAGDIVGDRVRQKLIAASQIASA